MTKKNKHLLKLLSLSLLPIAAISIPAVVLTSCSSGKEESSDNSNNNQPNNPDDNGGEDNTNPGGEGDNGEDNNPNVTNPTYPTFASADEVRKACDEAKIDSKYESEELFISETEYLSKFGSVLANNSKIANATIRYPQQDNLDTEKNEMDFMYITLFTTENKQISTNLSDYPMYLKDSSGNKWYINPNKAVRISFDELYMLSDEQLQYDSEEVQQLYKSYRDRRIWFKIDVSKYKEQVANLPISDSINGYKLFIDYQQNLPNKNTNIMNSYIFRELDEENILSLRDLWTYRLSNDKRFGLTSIFGLSDFVYMGDTHPVSTTYNPDDYQNNAIDPNSFGGVVAMKYLEQHPNAVRFIDSITFNAGVSEGGVITSDDVWNEYKGWNYFYIKKSNDLEAISSPLNNIKDTYYQYSRGESFPSITIDAKKMYDNVDLSSLQLKKLENGINWYVPDLSTNLIDLLLTVNNNKVFGDIGFPHDFNNNSPSIVWDKYGYTSEYSIFISSLKPAYYYPNFAVQDDGVHGYYSFDKYLNSLCYSTFTINFNQPNSK